MVILNSQAAVAMLSKTRRVIDVGHAPEDLLCRRGSSETFNRLKSVCAERHSFPDTDSRAVPGVRMKGEDLMIVLHIDTKGRHTNPFLPLFRSRAQYL